jgi:hypothetical protein
MVLNLEYLMMVGPAYVIAAVVLFAMRNRIKPLPIAWGPIKIWGVLGVIVWVLTVTTAIDIATLASGTFLSERKMLLFAGMLAGVLPLIAVLMVGKRMVAANPRRAELRPWLPLIGVTLMFLATTAGLWMNGLGSNAAKTQRSQVEEVGMTMDVIAFKTLQLSELGTVLIPVSHWGTTFAKGDTVEIAWAEGLFGKRRVLSLALAQKN